MAKPRKPKQADQHRSPHLVRLGVDIFEVFKELSQENHRPMTREVRLALIAWAEAKGKWPPLESLLADPGVPPVKGEES